MRTIWDKQKGTGYQQGDKVKGGILVICCCNILPPKYNGLKINIISHGLGVRSQGAA